MNQICLLCHSENVSFVYKYLPQYNDADIMQCNDCGHQFSIVRKEINIDELYNDEIYKIVENRNSIFDRIIQREYNGVLRQLDKFSIRKGNLLDFGCGKGKFGSLARENGWKVKAVETSPDRAAYARNVYGLDVNSEFYTAGSIFNIPFDVITLFHVLEHLPKPGILLDQLIKDNLTDKGFVVIEVPNMSSWQSGIAKENWIHQDVPRHIHHFSPERLEKLLQEINLRPLKTTSFSFHLGVLGMVDSLLKQFGYKKNIIYELKNKKSRTLIVMIALLLPVAYIVERVASGFGKGGVIRMYLIRK
jgi:2-polyprenyl-3-methyl-5-hydroxy-6-metoxy-1,4-benzoquinol methylase